MNNRSILILLMSVLAVGLTWSLALEAKGPPIRVDQAIPGEAEQGQTNLPVKIKGKGFQAGDTVHFINPATGDESQIHAATPVYDPDTGDLDTIIDVNDSPDAVGTYDIEVRRAGGRGGKGSDLFRVDSADGGGSNEQPNTPLRVTFFEQVGTNSLPSSMVTDGRGLEYVHKENVDATSKAGSIFTMDFPGLKWRGGRGRQLYFHYTCDDTTTIGGDCSLLTEYGDVEPTGNPGEYRSSLNTLDFQTYSSECPLSNPCPSNSMFDMEPGVSELVGMFAIIKCCKPYVELASSTNRFFNCIDLLSPAQKQAYQDGCFENGSAPAGAPMCNAIMTGNDLDPEAGNGNDEWTLQAEEVTTLMCTDDEIIGVTTFSFEILVERRD